MKEHDPRTPVRKKKKDTPLSPSNCHWNPLTPATKSNAKKRLTGRFATQEIVVDIDENIPYHKKILESLTKEQKFHRVTTIDFKYIHKDPLKLLHAIKFKRRLPLDYVTYCMDAFNHHRKSKKNDGGSSKQMKQQHLIEELNAKQVKHLQHVIQKHVSSTTTYHHDIGYDIDKHYLSYPLSTIILVPPLQLVVELYKANQLKTYLNSVMERLKQVNKRYNIPLFDNVSEPTIVLLLHQFDKEVKKMVTKIYEKAQRSFESSQIAPRIQLIRKEDMKKALFDIETTYRTTSNGQFHVIYTQSMADTINHIMFTGFILAKKPYSKSSSETLHLVRTKTFAKKVKTLDEMWVALLVEMAGISKKQAEGITQKYPTFQALYRTYRSLDSLTQCESLLENLEYPYSSTQTRRFNHKTSYDVYHALMDSIDHL
mmetsp:Transcript_6157/g.8960  ORF Transcript_6157/g.8960 Transcript_6157/m.8960 type:complete len:427 (+) Transcript_6157:13-1293(+)